MRVRELKKLLEYVNDDSIVLVYSGVSEDGDLVDGICEYKNTIKSFEDKYYGKNLPYAKGDWPNVEEEDTVLVIGGYSEFWPKSDL